ncbi:MAG: hypothetical protein H0X30_36325 [Anaerolineae bacterium]|nr:hypothetical protein [Anaerolineae bacterium]
MNDFAFGIETELAVCRHCRHETIPNVADNDDITDKVKMTEFAPVGSVNESTTVEV